ncbi:MAG: hypothetical protein EXR64_04960 [Dehalococcoidia bacterium]|nr:hypothetical protein [Dehalococcoidia bacterium]
MRRQREEELLVWPDLVFIEFISAVVFTILLVGLSVVVDAVLLDRANPAVTPNPSKAPWYFLNLQELLLHMHPALAGVIVPTIALIALGAIPYWDADHEGQGQWLSTPRAWANMWVGSIVGAFGTLLLIFFDDGQHAKLYERLMNASGVVANIDGKPNPDFNAWPFPVLRTMRDFQKNFPWDLGFIDLSKPIPLGNLLRTDLLGLPRLDLNVNIPAVVVEQMIPVGVMVGFPVLLSVVAQRRGLAVTRRDHMILQFAGFIATYLMLTVVGTYFRGLGLALGPYTIFAEK